MWPLLKTIRILVTIQLFATASSENAFGEQDVHLQQFTSNDDKINGLSFNTNLYQRDPNAQSVTATNTQFQQNDQANSNNEFGQRSPYSRSKKVYRIKNPFHNQLEESENQQADNVSQDSGTGASNQYASMQYSLPPDEFLQQLRAENQYYQQTQVSTPAPNIGYTATPVPQPQYQYSTIQYSTAIQPTYENTNQQGNNQIQLEPKSSYGTYLSSPSPYQYSTPNTYLDNAQSTPSPGFSYLSTPLNNGQYSSQSSSYDSSAAPIYVSSPSSQQSFVSSPLSIIQTGSPDYSNRVTSTAGNTQMNYDNIDYSSGRYQMNVQQQYQNEYSTTTTQSPASYSDHIRNMWQNNIHSGNNGNLLQMQSNMYNQYQNNQYQNKQEELRSESYAENSDTHRIGSLASANNMFVNYVQPDSQALNNLKLRSRDLDHEASDRQQQGVLYSNGDYGWKLTGKKPFAETYSSTNYNRYSPLNIETSDNAAVSQMNFHIGTVKPYNQFSKSSSDTSIEQEFAQAAAKAHERYKQQQQQQQQQYSNINNFGISSLGSGDVNYPGFSYYNNVDKQKNKLQDSIPNYYSYAYSQNDPVTASPFSLSTTRDHLDIKPKQPFDHDRALKNIVSIDVSNVVSNSESKPGTTLESSNRFFNGNYVKDQSDQNIRQYIRPVTDSFYKDKNAIYGFNIKTKTDEYSPADSFKQAEQTIYGKQSQPHDTNYNQGYSGSSQGLNYLTQTSSSNYQDNLQSSSMHQPGLHRNQNEMPTDIASILKINDIPYKLTQGLSSDALKLHNANFDQGGTPSSLPTRINQNVGSHHLDVTSNFLNKLLMNKQINKPETDSQTNGLMSTINGFRVANPYNVDLKLVSELLKGKNALDDSRMMSVRNQYTNPSPLNLDLNSQLQLLLKNDNNGNLAPINDGLSALGSSFMEIYSNSRYPYQKYSRSQEEEESLVPIAAASNTHPIGAVMESEDSASEREVSSTGDFTAQAEVFEDNYEENRPKIRYASGSRSVIGERQRHPNVLISGRHAHHKKHIKSDVSEPHPLLKPPPPHHSPRGGFMKMETKHNRRRRVHKPKLLRVIKTQPLFEAGAEPENMDNSVPILLRPPAPVAEAKSDIVDTDSQ